MKIIPVKFDKNAPVPRTLNHIRCITLCDMETDEWSKLFNALKYENRINRNVLENITYPQYRTTGVHQINIVDMVSKLIWCLDVNLSSRFL